MPTYEFECGKCGRTFEVAMTVSELGRTPPSCPGCGSTAVTQHLSAFVQTSKKS
jgi:putative FmdB family regulatory protein